MTIYISTFKRRWRRNQLVLVWVFVVVFVQVSVYINHVSGFTLKQGRRSIFRIGARVRNISNFFLNLFLHYILWIFQVVEIMGGGGETMFATPIFSWGQSPPPPPPPRIDASALKVVWHNYKTSWGILKRNELIVTWNDMTSDNLWNHSIQSNNVQLMKLTTIGVYTRGGGGCWGL